MKKENSNVIPCPPRPARLASRQQTATSSSFVSLTQPNVDIQLPSYVNPLLTAPLSSLENAPSLLQNGSARDTTATADDTDVSSESTHHKTCQLTARGEAGQPYPRTDREMQFIKRAKELPNRIVLKRSAVDGGIIFFIPTQINQFLEKLFNCFADPTDKTLSQQQFTLMVIESHLFAKLLRQETQSGSSTKPLAQTKLRRKNGFQKPKSRVECPMPPRLEKIIRCVFCHRDNTTGRPIRYNAFLRVLHRLARYKYRRYAVRDDEAVNALVTALARSGITQRYGPKPKPVLKDAQTESKVVTCTQSVMTTPELLKPKSPEHAKLETLKKPGLKKLPQPKPQEKVAAKPLAKLKSTEPKQGLVARIKSPQHTAVLKKPLTRVAFQLTEHIASVTEDLTESSKGTTTDSSVAEAQEIAWLERKAYATFRLYADNKKGEIPLMTCDGYFNLLWNCGLAEVFDLGDLRLLYDTTCDESDIDAADGITFFDFKNIVQELGEELFDDSAESVDEDEVYYRILRRYLLPLLYHCDNASDVDGKDKIPYHVVDELGRVLQPDNVTVADDVFLGPDGKVVNAKGEILEGDVYTLDGRLLEGPLVAFRFDAADNTIRDAAGRMVPGYRVIIGPDDSVLENVTVAPGGVVVPLSSNLLPPFTTASFLSKQPSSKKKDATGVVEKSDSDKKMEPSSPRVSHEPSDASRAESPKPKNVLVQQHNEVIQQQQTPPQQQAAASQTPSKTFLATPSTLAVSHPVEYYPQAVCPNCPFFPQPALPFPNVTSAQLKEPFPLVGGQFVSSPYVINYRGLVIREKDGEVINGFTAGPNDTILGPDGRPVCNARVGSDGRCIEIVTAVPHPACVFPTTSENFPAGWATDSSDENETSILENRRPLAPHKPLREKFIHREPVLTDIGLAGGPSKDILSRLERRWPIDAMQRTFAINAIDNESNAQPFDIQSAALEGYVWPPINTITSAGVDTPRFL